MRASPQIAMVRRMGYIIFAMSGYWRRNGTTSACYAHYYTTDYSYSVISKHPRMYARPLDTNTRGIAPSYEPYNLYKAFAS